MAYDAIFGPDTDFLVGFGSCDTTLILILKFPLRELDLDLSPISDSRLP